jgi:hypothetical protein
MLRQQQFGLLGINLVLSGCVLVPPQLSPPSHLVTIEPDGSVVKDECVLPRQTLVPSERIECLENGVKVIQECDSKGRAGLVYLNRNFGLISGTSAWFMPPRSAVAS